LSGGSVEVLEGLGSRQLDAALPLGDTILSGHPRVISSLGPLIRRYPVLAPHIGELNFRAVAYLPLVAQARSLGGLALFYRERTVFTADERILCLGPASIVAQSLQRAILFDEEREFATGLQSAMLPRRIQEIEGGEITVRYHAAWNGREVGGDWST
jgi:GAF domain-containing protein